MSGRAWGNSLESDPAICTLSLPSSSEWIWLSSSVGGAAGGGRGRPWPPSISHGRAHRRLPLKWLLLLPVTFSRFLAVFKPFLQNRPSRSHTPLNLSDILCMLLHHSTIHSLIMSTGFGDGPSKFANLAFGSFALSFICKMDDGRHLWKIPTDMGR